MYDAARLFNRNALPPPSSFSVTYVFPHMLCRLPADELLAALLPFADYHIDFLSLFVVGSWLSHASRVAHLTYYRAFAPVAGKARCTGVTALNTIARHHVDKECEGMSPPPPTPVSRSASPSGSATATPPQSIAVNGEDSPPVTPLPPPYREEVGVLPPATAGHREGAKECRYYVRWGRHAAISMRCRQDIY